MRERARGAGRRRARIAAVLVGLAAIPAGAARAAPGDRSAAPEPAQAERPERSAAARAAAARDAGPAAARPADLAVRRLPLPWPASLRMRPSGAADVPAPGAGGPGTPSRAVAATGTHAAREAAPGTAGKRVARDAFDDARRQRRLLRALPRSQAPGLDERVVFRFNLGLGLDGGEPSGAPMLSGALLDESGDQATYARIRVYSFGDAVLGSRGLVTPSLSTYLAAQFRFDQGFGSPSTAVPSVQDSHRASDVVVRSGYAEISGPLDLAWLDPLFVRAGRQYRYGPAVAHFDGLTIGYDTRVLSASAFVGQGVDVHGFSHGSLFANGGTMAGLSLRLDLFELGRGPLVLSGNLLQYADHSHADGAVALRWNRDISLQAGIRALDGASARQYLRARARISEVTLVALDVDHRGRGDWMYDLLAVEPAQASDPRRYLDLGRPLPRTYLGVRAGTVLLDNIDLLVRGGAAFAHTDPEEPGSTYSASYAEAGASLEVRVRRTLAMGASVLARTYGRDRDPAAGAPDPLGNGRAGMLDLSTGHLGERSFVEAGSTARFTLGARRFNAGIEAYLRYYDTPPLHPEVALADADVRGGGRFDVEGWAGDRLRIKAEYDVSTDLATVPELRGIKSLRVLLEGRM